MFLLVLMVNADVSIFWRLVVCSGQLYLIAESRLLTLRLLWLCFMVLAIVGPDFLAADLGLMLLTGIFSTAGLSPMVF